MSRFYLLILFFAAITPILVAIDCLNCRKPEASPSKDEHSSDELSNSLLFLPPLLSIFYPDDFWCALAFLASLSLLATALRIACYKVGWLNRPPEYVYLLPGSCLISIFIYFIFFHEGQMHAAQLASLEANTSNQWELNKLWIFALYIAATIFAITRKGSGGIIVASLITILLFNLLPFFTGYFWVSITAGITVFAVIVQRLVSRLEDSVKGGFAFVSAFTYLTVTFLSVFFYAM